MEQFLGFFFQQKEEVIMGKNVGIRKEREESNISLSYRF